MSAYDDDYHARLVEHVFSECEDPYCQICKEISGGDIEEEED